MQLSFDDLTQRAAAEEKYTVSQIVQAASRLLETRFGEIWVEGEVSNVRRPSSGHLYFTLKDEKAQLAAVMFRSAAGRLKFTLEDGLKLLCRGRLGIYDAQGRFQLTVETAHPEGAGALQLAFEQLRRKLQEEGLFSAEHKKPLPLLPRTIVVVTSPTGAAVRDVLRVLHDRCPVRVVICPTAVQGEEAPEEIVRALQRADRLGADLIILGRGGGSLEDLWAFNTEPVARAIFAAITPIICGVGHEVDVTIADLVADYRAPTPTAAAEMAVPVMAELRELLSSQRLRLERAVLQHLRDHSFLLQRWRRELRSPGDRINRLRLRLDDASSRLETTMIRRLTREREALSRWCARLAQQEPRLRLSHDRAALLALRQRLTSCCREALQEKRGLFASTMGRLEALSPLAVMSRGYCLAFDAQERIIRRAEALAVGDALTLRLYRGRLLCKVDEIEPESLDSRKA